MGTGPRTVASQASSGWRIWVDINNNGTFEQGGPDLWADTDGSGNYQITGIPPGTYDIYEVQQATWTCTDPAGDCDHDDVVFTDGVTESNRNFGNTQRATVTVNKDAIPDDGQDFSYTTTGGFNPATFSLEDDGDEGTNPSTQQFTFTGTDFDAGDETISEDGETGWALTDLVCTGDDDYQESGSTATLNVEPGETIVCDYENTKNATVTVNKDAIPDDGQDFSYTTTGGFNPATFSLEDDGDEGTNPSTQQFTFTGTDFDAGDETISEDGETGWALTDLVCTGDDDYQESGSTATLNVEPGETIVCDYENTKNATVTVNKDAIPDDGQDFSYTTTGGFNPATFSLEDDGDEGTNPSTQQFTFTGTDFDAGDETISEDGETGWALTDLVCTGDDDYQESGSTATLNVEPGETIVCDYENTKNATVTVNKDAIPDDGQDFSYTTTGGFNPATFSLEDDGDEGTNPSTQQFTFTGTDFDAGDETISEDGETGWALTDLVCTGDDDYQESGSTATLNVEPGETIVCDYENTKNATVTVNKDAIPDDGQDFSYTTTGGFNPATFSLEDDGDEGTNRSTQQFTFTGTDFDAGDETISEDGETGWALTDLICTGDDDYQESGSTATLNVEPGETIVCDYENTKNATVTVNKDAIPDDGQDFSYTTTGGFNPATFSLEDDGERAPTPPPSSSPSPAPTSTPATRRSPRTARPAGR